jgi:hypothetical protein
MGRPMSPSATQRHGPARQAEVREDEVGALEHDERRGAIHGRDAENAAAFQLGEERLYGRDVTGHRIGSDAGSTPASRSRRQVWRIADVEREVSGPAVVLSREYRGPAGSASIRRTRSACNSWSSSS